MDMGTLEVVLAIISICSFGIALFQFIRSEKKEANERANIEILRAKLNFIYKGLSLTFHTADTIVQKGKSSETTVKDLQDIARILRAQSYQLAATIKNSRKNQKTWIVIFVVEVQV